MPILRRLEAEIAALPEPELREFRRWFADFEAKRWDKKLEADAASGKLDALAAEALAQFEAGKCKPL